MILIKCDKCPAGVGAGGTVGAGCAWLVHEGACSCAACPPVALGSPSADMALPPLEGTHRRHGGPRVWNKHVYCRKGVAGAGARAHQAKSGLLSSLESSHRQLSSRSESPRNLGGTMSMTSLRRAAGLLCSGLARRSGRCFRMP